MSDMTAKKQDFIYKESQMASQILSLLKDVDDMVAYYFANGFNSGGSNEIIDADCIGSMAYSNASTITGIITQLQALSGAVTQGGRDVLRQGENAV